MSSTKYAWGVAAVVAGLLAGAQLIPATASADPETPPQPQVEPVPDQQLHNVTYKARIDGVSRNATITYKIDDSQVNTADPTMLPGRTFEATGVVSDPQLAGMKVSIDWPYSANLHCEVLVDDQIVAQADTWVGPRLTRQLDDPGYGSLPCGASVDNVGANVVNTGPVPADPAAPVAPPAEVPPAA
ncbi:hypothetical protein [Mycolicibacterium mageritense]|uniref:hypothetical protein n=1 Tax=Mycolicibacterium mageritense TaxID=53462 RepID=UPI001E2876F1|nr:hypothetical protein [Mycolicibacterium mageritense]GJJ16747.1 hypothetical protein MTY414_04200 [Mycolicibacterium mageritense]